MDATKTKAIETSQPLSEKRVVNQENASKWLKTRDSNMLVCNMVENAGEVTLEESMERDLILNVI
jgi:hypothetical protein